MTIGERIREVRKSKNLTQKQLGELSGIAEPTIRRYELGKLNPKRETITKIATALDVHPAVLSDDLFDSEFLSLLQQKMRPGEDFRTAFIGGSVQIAILRGDNDRHLIEGYDMLNERGQWMAVNYVQDLAEKAEYLKDIYTKAPSELKKSKEVNKPLPYSKNRKPPQD